MQFLEFQVCRGCLATDTRMVDTRQHSASDFTRLVELLPTSKVGLPPCVCYECLAQLTKMREFRAKNQRAYNVLHKIIRHRGWIEETDIKQIDRTQQSLTSPLKYYQIESISIDPKLSCSDAEVDHVDDKITAELTEMKIEFKQEKKIKSEGFFEELDDLFDDDREEVGNKDIVQENKAEKENVKEAKRKKVKTQRTRRNIKNVMPIIRKKRKTKDNSELEPAADAEKLPKGTKEQIPGTSLKVDPVKSNYTEDFHSFATLTIMAEEERLEFFKRRGETQKYKDAEYKCTDCYLGFMATNTYEKHLKKHDPSIGAYVCPVCKCRYKTERLKNKHVAVNHRTKFECKHCPYVCTNGDTARYHSESHSSATYRCKECNYISAHLTSYDLHVSTMHGEETPCPCCGVSFLGLGAMRAHMDSDHPKPSRVRRRLRCECGATFYNPDARKLHLSTSSKHKRDGNTLLSCKLCDAHFTDNKSLKVHMHAHTQERKDTAPRPATMTCEQCGEPMATRKAYRTHCRTVHPDKAITSFATTKYPDMLCDICGKVLKGKNYLEEHRLMHAGLAPFACNICGKTFKWRACYIIHMNIHTKQYVYKCAVCGKAFNNASGRRRHMLVHTQEKLFPCDICGKSFKSRVHMLYHKRYVHMKKPWPKRDRGKPKPSLQEQYSDQESSDYVISTVDSH